MSETHLIEQAPSMLGDDMDHTQINQDVMDDRATKSLLDAGKKTDRATTELRSTKSKDIPDELAAYIEEHDLNAAVKKALNKVLREKPAEPLSAIAGQLFASATKSYPVFERFEASRIFLQESVTC